jgi:ATP-binding cassette subfamily B protein
MIFGKALTKYYKQNWHYFLIGIIALIIVDIAQLEIPRYIGNLFDGLTPIKNEATGLLEITLDRSQLIEIILTISGLALIMGVGRFVWRITIFGASRRFDYGLRNDMFQHCEQLSQEFYSKNKTGGLMAYFTNDLEAVRRGVGPGMIMFVDALFLGILAIVRMVEVNASLAFYSAIPLTLITLLGGFFGGKMRKKFKEAQKAFEDMSDFVTENLSGIAVVKAFVKEKVERQEFLRYNRITKNKNIKYVVLNTMLQTSVRFIIGAIFILIIGYGGYLVQQDVITGGKLVEFFSLFGTLVWPMMAIGMIIGIRSRSKASLERITSILDQEIHVYDSDDLQTLDEVKGSITFKNLTFSYPDASEDVLSNINLEINAGETVGILGRTGSGKTSIMDLLLRIYNVEENQLFIDGKDIMYIPIEQVRESIAYVPQDGFLFSDSINNNIALGFGQVDEQLIRDVEEAAKLSDVHENIVDFTEGYDTIIGERGVTLSGGQRQRISIARAIIKNSPIMILDDSVSAVDTKTEETILSNLKDIRNNKTTLIIAHRISTIKDADKIVVIDEGKIIDVGTNEELLTRCEFYKDMVERQKLEDEIEVL